MPGAYMSSSSSITLPSTLAPSTTSCMRFNERRKVLFPHPDGPMMAVTDFGSMVIETPERAVNEPK